MVVLDEQAHRAMLPHPGQSADVIDALMSQTVRRTRDTGKPSPTPLLD
jgi:hypothetical protein